MPNLSPETRNQTLNPFDNQYERNFIDNGNAYRLL
jgi:hypothetical protein